MEILSYLKLPALILAWVGFLFLASNFDFTVLAGSGLIALLVIVGYALDSRE